MGFTPGAYCKRKTEKVAMECQAQSVEGKTAQLKELKSGGLLKIGTEDFMAGQWILFKPKAGPECLEDLTGMGPHDSEEFKLALMIADIHQEVHGLVKSCDSHKTLSKLAIQIKPAKGIIAKAAFPKGKLVLAPYSMKVITRKTKAEPLPNAVRVVCPAWKEREFWLANPNQWPKESSEDSGFISPVFCMQNTDEEDLANMEVFLSGNKTLTPSGPSATHGHGSHSAKHSPPSWEQASQPHLANEHKNARRMKHDMFIYQKPVNLPSPLHSPPACPECHRRLQVSIKTPALRQHQGTG